MLVVLGTGIGIVGPPVKALHERARVDRAVAELRGILFEARRRAVGRGAEVRLTTDPPRATLLMGDSTVRSIQLSEGPHDVSVDYGRRSTVRLRFDALGIGRFSAASIGFSSGMSSRRVVISAWGRVRVE